MSETDTVTSQTIWNLVASGGYTLYVLMVCSLLVWGIIFERIWNYRRLGQGLRSFHLEASNLLLRNDFEKLRRLCNQHFRLPTAQLLMEAMERLNSKDARVKAKWQEAIERKRQLINVELKQNLWILGTIGSAAPFIGLFGTVVGILRSFQEMARSGSGGFAVVAAGISEALVATAAGIIVAVVAVMAFNAFQTKWSQLILLVRVQIEELSEILISDDNYQLGNDLKKESPSGS